MKGMGMVNFMSWKASDRFHHSLWGWSACASVKIPDSHTPSWITLSTVLLTRTSLRNRSNFHGCSWETFLKPDWSNNWCNSLTFYSMWWVMLAACISISGQRTHPVSYFSRLADFLRGFWLIFGSSEPRQKPDRREDVLQCVQCGNCEEFPTLNISKHNLN